MKSHVFACKAKFSANQNTENITSLLHPAHCSCFSVCVCVCATVFQFPGAHREHRNGFMIEEDFPEARWIVCHFPPKEPHHAERVSLYGSAALRVDFQHFSWFQTFLLPEDMAIKLAQRHKIKLPTISTLSPEAGRVLFTSRNCLCPDDRRADSVRAGSWMLFSSARCCVMFIFASVFLEIEAFVPLSLVSNRRARPCYTSKNYDRSKSLYAPIHHEHTPTHTNKGRTGIFFISSRPQRVFFPLAKNKRNAHWGSLCSFFFCSPAVGWFMAPCALLHLHHIAVLIYHSQLCQGSPRSPFCVCVSLIHSAQGSGTVTVPHQPYIHHIYL